MSSGTSTHYLPPAPLSQPTVGKCKGTVRSRLWGDLNPGLQVGLVRSISARVSSNLPYYRHPPKSFPFRISAWGLLAGDRAILAACLASSLLCGSALISFLPWISVYSSIRHLFSPSWVRDKIMENSVCLQRILLAQKITVLSPWPF